MDTIDTVTASNIIKSIGVNPHDFLSVNELEANEVCLHSLANLLMSRFPHLEPMSLDEFVLEHGESLSNEQKSIAYTIINLF